MGIADLGSSESNRRAGGNSYAVRTECSDLLRHYLLSALKARGQECSVPVSPGSLISVFAIVQHEQKCTVNATAPSSYTIWFSAVLSLNTEERMTICHLRISFHVRCTISRYSLSHRNSTCRKKACDAAKGNGTMKFGIHGV